MQPSWVQVRDTATTVVALTRVIARFTFPAEAATVSPIAGSGSRSTTGEGSGGVSGPVGDPLPPQRTVARAVQAAPSRHTNSRRPDRRLLSIELTSVHNDAEFRLAVTHSKVYYSEPAVWL